LEVVEIVVGIVLVDVMVVAPHLAIEMLITLLMPHIAALTGRMVFGVPSVLGINKRISRRLKIASSKKSKKKCT
jgi:hypothetical protein